MKRRFLFLILTLLTLSVRSVVAFTAELKAACDAIRNGTASPYQKSLAYSENYAVNNMALTGDISTRTYNAVQNLYNKENNGFVDAINLENPGTDITKQLSTKPSQGGADTDLFRNAPKNPKGMRKTGDLFNSKAEAYVTKGGVKTPGPGKTDYMAKNDLDIMVNIKSSNVNAGNFNAFNQYCKGTLYKDYWAAVYEFNARAGLPPDVNMSGNLVNEMVGQIGDKIAKQKGYSKLMTALKKHPCSGAKGSRAYGAYKSSVAEVHKLNAQISKYLERIGGKKDAKGKPIGCTQAIADHHGLPGPKGSDLPKIGADRVPGNYNSAVKVGSLAKNLTKQNVMEYAETLGKLAKKNPTTTHNAACGIAKGANGLDNSTKGELIENLKSKFGERFAKKVVSEMKNLNTKRPPPGPFGDGSLTLTKGGSFKMTSTKGMSTASKGLGLGGGVLVGFQVYEIYEDYCQDKDAAKAAEKGAWMAAFMVGGRLVMKRVAPYAPTTCFALGTYMVSRGLTEQLLKRTKTGQAINQAVADKLSDSAEMYDDWRELLDPVNLLPGVPKPAAMDTHEVNDYADKMERLIRLVKSGKFEPRFGRTMGETMYALNYRPLSELLQKRKPKPPEPKPLVEPVEPSFDQAAYEAAYFDAIKKGLIKPSEKDKFSYAYDPKTKGMDPAKAKAFDEADDEAPDAPVDTPVVGVVESSGAVSNLWEKYKDDPRLVYTRTQGGEKVPLGLRLPQPHIGAVTVTNPAGFWVEHPDDGPSTAEFFNGVPHGDFIRRRRDGSVSSVQHFENGQVTQSWTYHPNGRLECQDTIEYGADGEKLRSKGRQYDQDGKLYSQRQSDALPDGKTAWYKGTTYHEDGPAGREEGPVPWQKTAKRRLYDLPELPTKVVPFDEVEAYLAKLDGLPMPPPLDNPPTLEDLLAQGETDERLTRAGALGEEDEAPKNTFEQRLDDALAAKKAGGSTRAGDEEVSVAPSHEKAGDFFEEKKGVTETRPPPKSAFELRLQEALESKKNPGAVRAPSQPESAPSFDDKLQDALRRKTREPKVPLPEATTRQPSQPPKIAAADTRDGTYKGTAVQRSVLNDAALAAALKKRGASVTASETMAFTAEVAGGQVTLRFPAGIPLTGSLVGNHFKIRTAAGGGVFTASGTVANGKVRGKGVSQSPDGKMSLHITFDGVRVSR